MPLDFWLFLTLFYIFQVSVKITEAEGEAKDLMEVIFWVVKWTVSPD
jgi:hypothetical protein